MVNTNCAEVESKIGSVGLLMEGYVFDMQPSTYLYQVEPGWCEFLVEEKSSPSHTRALDKSQLFVGETYLVQLGCSVSVQVARANERLRAALRHTAVHFKGAGDQGLVSIDEAWSVEHGEPWKAAHNASLLDAVTSILLGFSGVRVEVRGEMSESATGELQLHGQEDRVRAQACHGGACATRTHVLTPSSRVSQHIHEVHRWARLNHCSPPATPAPASATRRSTLACPTEAQRFVSCANASWVRCHQLLPNATCAAAAST